MPATVLQAARGRRQQRSDLVRREEEVKLDEIFSSVATWGTEQVNTLFVLSNEKIGVLEAGQEERARADRRFSRLSLFGAKQ